MAIVAFVIVAYLGVVLMAWQELRCIHNQQQRHNGELERLELAHKSIEQGIELIESNITKCVGDEVRSQEEKLTNLQGSSENLMLIWRGLKKLWARKRLKSHRTVRWR